MENSKVIHVSSEGIKFDNDITMISQHNQDCCEWHELTFDDLTMQDFKGLSFDLTKDDFFNRIEGFGIELLPVHGHSVKIPGHGSNNGYYGSNIHLVLIDENNKVYKSYDVSECQDY